jgi:undecaprenyl diphosphate synthase
MNTFDQIDLTRVPHHVAIIMDGNGRWAKSQGRERAFGHFNGVDAVRASLKSATRCGVKYLTLYAFSTENWNRPKAEIDALMDLLVRTITNEIEELDKNGVRLMAIGNLAQLPDGCREELQNAMSRTEHNSKIQLILALSYSSKWEITEAVKAIVQSGVNAENVSAELIQEHLCTKHIPDPELLIRTSGEHRISNFLLWQIAYAELYFTDTLWPDFQEEDFFPSHS